jgi:hypothetical protein
LDANNIALSELQQESLVINRGRQASARGAWFSNGVPDRELFSLFDGLIVDQYVLVDQTQL